jgi:hypothetical protein
LGTFDWVWGGGLNGVNGNKWQEISAYQAIAIINWDQELSGNQSCNLVAEFQGIEMLILFFFFLRIEMLFLLMNSISPHFLVFFPSPKPVVENVVQNAQCMPNGFRDMNMVRLVQC